MKILPASPETNSNTIKYYLTLKLTAGPGMPRRPSAPVLPDWPWGPTGPVFPTGPWVPVAPCRAQEQPYTVRTWDLNGSQGIPGKDPTCRATKLGACCCSDLGSLRALLPFFSCSAYMTLGWRKTMFPRGWFIYKHIHTQT